MDYRNDKSSTNKKSVIDELWGDEAKSGNEYRNLSKQIDNFLKHLKEEESPLQWLPLEELSDQQIVELTITFLNRSQKESRLLYNNIEHSEIICNYNELMIKDLEGINETKIICEVEPIFKRIIENKLKILDTMKYTKESFRCRQETSLSNTIFLLNVDEYNKNIYEDLMYENSLFKAMGLKQIYMDYLEEYIYVVERIILGSLFFTVVLNKSVEDKNSAYERINEKIKNLKMFQKCEQESKKEILNHIQEVTGEKLKLNISDVMGCFVRFLRRKSLYKEHEKIMIMLQKENEQLINSENNIALKETKNLKKIIMKNGKKLSESNRKLNDVSELLRNAQKLDNDFVDSNIDWTNIIIREAFVSKQKYERKTAMTVIRKINKFGIKDENDNHKINSKYLMFLDAKFIRGVFWESNILSEYKSYCDICIAIRELFLLLYELFSEIDAYKWIYIICSELLNEFSYIINKHNLE